MAHQFAVQSRVRDARARAGCNLPTLLLSFPFRTHCELYRIDLASDRAQWLDFPVSDYA